ncbi:MAG: hypothetical protein RBR78_09720 [Flavobacteriaceae bacterium]|jgi:hypothetical protein|nr:hypothetical protein [Flavobacteriaceae bacterium]
MKEPNIQTIKEFLEFNVGILFQREEIAYLGLTSKIEIQLRDKLALALHNEFKDQFIVTREWKKCDLAILNKHTLEPILLLELKNCYSCDLIKNSTLKEYELEIKKDLNKSETLSTKNTLFYSILFVTKPRTIIPDEYLKVIKYSKAINTALKKWESWETIEILGEANFRNLFDIIYEGNIKKDTSFGIECAFYYFIVKNH